MKAKIRTFLLPFLILILLYSLLAVSNDKFRNKQITKSKASEINLTPTEIILNPIRSNNPTNSPTLAIRPIYLGMWTQGFWDDTNKTLHPEALISLEKKLEKHFTIAHYYRGWEYLEKEELRKELITIDSFGWRPILSVNPYFFARCAYQDKSIYKVIAEGSCDDFIRASAQNLKQFGKPLFLRFAWEMNLVTNEWGIAKTKSSPEDFVAAWRHLHDIFVGEGVTNVLWVWSPNTKTEGSTAYNLIYPGDGYVDWIGLDAYNWGTTQSWSSWQSFTQVFRDSYNELISVAPNKPLMVAEVNTTDKGGDKAAWYRNFLNQEITFTFPAVSAVVIYNEDRTQKENVNWLIDISPESFSAFKQGIQPAFYRSSF